VCLACPVLLGILLVAFPDELLNPLNEFLHSLRRFRYEAGTSLAIIVSALLAVLTLLITNLVAQIRILNHRGLDSN
jgi:hypothetical protein